MKKIVAVMPIKLQNERLPGKNTKELAGKPLIQYSLDTLLKIEELDSINVFCSDESICEYLPDGVQFIRRSVDLDKSTSNFTQIFDSFRQVKEADIYVYAHATAPYVSYETMKECIDAVVSGKYDSAFCAVKIQDYLWKNGNPLNFDATNLPRSQDIEPIYRETSGVYVFTKEVFETYKRRIGVLPYIKEVSFVESIDINNPEDFVLAEQMNKYYER